MKPLRIAYVIDTLACDTAGTQKQLLESIRRLDRSRFSPILICLWESEWMRTAVLPCEVHVLGHTGFLKPGLGRVVREFRRLVRECEVDLIHTYFDESIVVTWLATRAMRRRPVLISSRRDMGLGTSNQPWYHRLYRLIMPVVNRDFDGVIANCDAVAAHAAKCERTAPERYTVIRNGLDLPVGRGEPSALPLAAGGRLNVCILASLTPVKRHDLLIDAWSSLGEVVARAGAHLYILGDGPKRASIESQCVLKGVMSSVHFPGVVTDVADWLSQMDIGVICSDREGLSNAILEYMAHGLPVIATEVGGNPELVNSDNGILVPAGNAAELARALERLLTDGESREELGRRSLARMEGTYSWKATLGQTTSLYERLLAGPR